VFHSLNRTFQDIRSFGICKLEEHEEGSQRIHLDTLFFEADLGSDNYTNMTDPLRRCFTYYEGDWVNTGNTQGVRFGKERRMNVRKYDFILLGCGIAFEEFNAGLRVSLELSFPFLTFAIKNIVLI
jgi:hypothetical protein